METLRNISSENSTVVSWNYVRATCVTLFQPEKVSGEVLQRLGAEWSWTWVLESQTLWFALLFIIWVTMAFVFTAIKQGNDCKNP